MERRGVISRVTVWPVRLDRGVRRIRGVAGIRARAVDTLAKRGNVYGDDGDFSGPQMGVLAQCGSQTSS